MIQGQPGLQNAFQDSQGYTVRSCLKYQHHLPTNFFQTKRSTAIILPPRRLRQKDNPKLKCRLNYIVTATLSQKTLRIFSNECAMELKDFNNEQLEIISHQSSSPIVFLIGNHLLKGGLFRLFSVYGQADRRVLKAQMKVCYSKVYATFFPETYTYKPYSF